MGQQPQYGFDVFVPFNRGLVLKQNNYDATLFPLGRDWIGDWLSAMSRLYFVDVVVHDCVASR
jgi:hypothetical protein